MLASISSTCPESANASMLNISSSPEIVAGLEPGLKTFATAPEITAGKKLGPAAGRDFSSWQQNGPAVRLRLSGREGERRWCAVEMSCCRTKSGEVPGGPQVNRSGPPTCS